MSVSLSIKDVPDELGVGGAAMNVTMLNPFAAQARFGEDGLALSNAAPAFTPAFTFTRMRSARPSDRLAELRRFYVDALGCALLGEFTAHDGFDGLIVGHPSGAWQIEFVREHACPAPPVPSHEHLLVFYVADRIELAERAAAMAASGCTRTDPSNPYWSRFGVTFVDPDGYPVVLAVPHGA